ncbi:cytochrome P450 [Comamonas fluminis]|uniref:cytochrome P450 n=1 Tax=Comamonas fluminis TaxID=2796366 RepID=UPI001C48FDB2|nr:cytochrome P450 [Comamonas fluminis]
MLAPVNDIVSPGVYANPELLHARYARYRREEPVAWIDQEPYRPFWAVTRHADIMEVERQHQIFINEPRVTLVPREVEDQTTAALGKRTAMVRSLLDMDEPDHRKYRAVAQSWFMGPGVARFQSRVDTVCSNWIDRMQEQGGQCDFAADIANFVPLSVIMTILGLPESDMQFVLRSTQQLFGASDPDMQDDSGDYGRTVFMQLMGYLGELVERRRREPTDDLASVIANGVIDGAPMAMLETLSYLLVTSTAGHETTASALAGGLLAMLQNPDQLQLLRDRPELWNEGAADEVVRWVTPIRHMMRTATQDYVLRGKQIKAGDSLAMLYLSANRDEEAFVDPFRFDVQRTNSRHLAFGFGVHFCLGRLLALNEIKSFFKQLLQRVEHIELAGEAVQAQSNFVGTLKSLPVCYRFKS